MSQIPTDMSQILPIKPMKLMDNSNEMVPPHLNAEVYRTDTTGTDTVSYLDYIRIHPDGKILVGCSELTGRYWNGGACVLSNVSEASKVLREKKKSVSLISGSPDGCFVFQSNRILLGEDNGAVSIWAAHNNAWEAWTEEISVAEHDAAVLGVACLDEGKEYVTVGADGTIKVWDISDMICIRNYNGAHSRAIHGVAVKPETTDCFATASLDYTVTFWDDNISTPVLDIVKNDCGIRCLTWTNENKIVFGDEAGILQCVDIRNTKSLETLTKFPAAVHRLDYQPKTHNVAVCCDNKTVTILNMSDDSQRIVYQDKTSHQNYVRGVAWDHKEDNLLHSIGWDGELKSHRL